jgi:hypothetical protein
LLPGLIQGQSTGGLRFLDIGADPLSLSLSETKTAVRLGTADLLVNPANLAFAPASSVGLAHTFWIADTRNLHAGVNLRKKNQALAFGVYTSLISDLQARQTPGASNGAFSWQYYAFAAALAQKIGNISVGATGMYLYEQVYLSSAKGFAVNAGVSGQWLDDRIRLATSLQSLGRMEPLNATRSEVPGRFRLGADLEAAQFSVRGSTEIPIVVRFAADYIKPIAWIDQEQDRFTPTDGFKGDPDQAWLSMGLRAEISELITLRGGYTTANHQRPFSMGLGVKRYGVEANFAYVPFNDGYGSAFSMGLNYRF